MMIFTVAQLADKINAKVIGDADVQLTGINSLSEAGQDQLSFFDSQKHVTKLKDSSAAAILTFKEVQTDKPQLIVEDVNRTLIDVLNLFAPKLKPILPGIAPSAFVDETAKVADSASVGHNVCVGEGAVVGENCIIGNNVEIGRNVVVGDNSKVDANVAIYHDCVIGKNCLLQAGAVIGSVGFGYSFIDGQHQLIPHIGGVIIEDCVHIGANGCIDRAKFNNTIIGAGTKIDNLVQIGHNVIIGKCCLLAAFVGISGSTKLGNGVVMGGQAGIADNVNVGDGVMIGAQSGVLGEVKPGERLMGSPAVSAKDRVRQHFSLAKLPDALKQLKQLAKKVEQLEKTKNN